MSSTFCSSSAVVVGSTKQFYDKSPFTSLFWRRYYANKQRYIDYGMTGTGQTRVVVDLETNRVYLSTHYERPKILLINGATPQAMLTHARRPCWLPEDRGVTQLGPASAVEAAPAAHKYIVARRQQSGRGFGSCTPAIGAWRQPCETEHRRL